MDMLDILKENGFNYIRLRLFVDPTAEVPEDVEAGLGGGWRASPYSLRGYCGLDSTIKYAQKVRDAGFKFLLDFHYSDTWADPGKQYKPVSWRGLSFQQLTERVRSYTRESLEAFRDAGVLPDMVQVGNEVINGMIHPDGRNWASGGVGGWPSFARLVHAGMSGVRDVDTTILIMMHTVSERNPNGWLTSLKSNLNQIETGFGDKIDIFGISYYPRWHGDLDSLSRVLNTVANNHDIKISVVEYADLHREVNDIVFNLPDEKGFGTFVWEPQEFAGDDSRPLFTWRSGGGGINIRETNSLMTLYPQMAIDYGNDNATAIGEKSTRPNLEQNRRPDFRIGHDGVIGYYSNAPGVVTIYNIQGRVVGRFDVKTPGAYNPARLLGMRPGAYIIAIKPDNAPRQVFNYRVVR
jgi:arabinogalactan endo-1,4-beta-galactosidase